MSWPIFFALSSTLILIALYIDFILPDEIKQKIRERIDSIFDFWESLDFNSLIFQEVERFSKAIDLIFGQRIFSVRAILTSLFLSLICIDYVIAVGGNDDDFAWNNLFNISMYFSMEERSIFIDEPLVILPLIFINLVTDLISLNVTRILIRKMVESTKVRQIINLLIADFLIGLLLLLVYVHLSWLAYKGNSSWGEYIEMVTAVALIALGVTAVLPTIFHAILAFIYVLCRIIAKPFHWLVTQTLFRVAISEKPIITLIFGGLTAVLGVANLWYKTLK